MRDAADALDFPRVLAALAERTQTPMGRARALALAPGDRAAAERLHERIAEARFFPIRLGGASDLSPWLTTLRQGERLESEALLEAARTLALAMEVKAALLETDLEGLKEVALKIGDHRPFTEAVARALDEHGEVKDDASPRLKKIRARLEPLRRRIQERMHALLDRYAEALQDRYITVRRDRYVLPVRAERQHEVPGIVLDQSGSGATLFIEPLTVVPLNNELAKLRLEEEAEVRRILAELSSRLAQDPGVEDTLEALGELDLAEAGHRLAEDWNLARPSFGPKGRYRLEDAFHPLIRDPVPNDIELDDNRRILLVSGPNMGGKTLLLKTLGLAQLMAQSGLFVPAKKATLPFVREVLVDIGDEQDVLASLSTFASHLERLKRIVLEADEEALFLIDELGTGTDPDEGTALAEALLEVLLRRGARGIVTTHLTPLKVFAGEHQGIENASMAFDAETLRPTYRLSVGTPGRSYAFAIARRLGFPEAVLRRAEALMGEGQRTLEALLERLEAEREALEAARAEAESARRRAEALEAKLASELAAIETERQRRLEEARQQADSLLLAAEREIKRLKTQAKSPQAKKDALKRILELRQQVRPQPMPTPFPELKPGTLVEVPEYRAKGKLIRISGDVAVVQLGALKVTVPAAHLRPRDVGAPKPKEAVVVKSGFEPELNVRGLSVEEALLALDEFLTEARALKESPVRILHGKGTGALRTAIRQALKRDKRVERFHDAMPYEGGHGVTVVHLKR